MKSISLVGIAGSGTMGASMAETFAKFGYSVIIYDISTDALEKARSLIEINQLTEVSEKIITDEESDVLLRRIEYTSDLQDLSGVDFLVEAIVENLTVKQQFWAQASDIVPEDAVLATNTSGLSITAIAEYICFPERFLGMHWINPPHLIPLIELISGEKTDGSYVQLIYDLCVKINKKPVIVKDAPGFVLNRIQLAILRECMHIVETGIAAAEDVDRVMKYALGIRYACLGPFEVLDHGGLDILCNIAEYLYPDLCDAKKPAKTFTDAVQKGNLGVKTGKGIYDYSDGKDKEAIIYRDKMYTKVSRCIFEE
ncbi:MAG: 3-hydroxyacyl-CoA dehydrogenase family protein [Lentihominibacter sp.]|jgi:3-hydroxybutyryl-CoA dehydrogenase